MKKAVFIAVLFLCVGCATGLNIRQEHEMKTFKARGLAVEEKSVGAAVGLGFLPGGGSFYTRNYGLGVCNLLFWPLSIFWDPVSGSNGAQSINYYATVEHVKHLRKAEIKQLDRDFEDGRLERNVYIVKKREIEDRYEID